MKRREFVKISALAGAVGAGAYTGAGALGEMTTSDETPTATTSGAVNATAATSTRTATETATETDTPTASPTPTNTETATPTETPTATATESPTPTATESPTPSPTATPDPRHGMDVHVEFINDYEEAYVDVKNENGYSVEFTLTLSWDYSNGDSEQEVRVETMGPYASWEDNIFHDDDQRTISQVGHSWSVRRI